VYTGYKPKTHNIEELADQTALLHPVLEGALPRTEDEDKRLFDLLKRAYIEARYSKSYRITLDELRILRERVHDLALRVRQACAEKLASFCGPEQVGPLPEVPSIADIGELPEAPSTDDPAAVQAWREALLALSYERGQQAGQQEGFDRGTKEGFDRGQQAGLDRGITKGQIQALWSILAARGITVDAEARAKIEACHEPDVLNQWIARAMTVASAADLFAPGPEAAERG
jgi:hypothetical protein